MFKYRLHYLSDMDDACERHYESEFPVKIGDVIKPGDGFYYCVVKEHKQKTGVRLDLSKSAQDTEEAVLLAQQYGHL